MSDFHMVVFFNDYYTLIVAFLTKQIQNRYRYRRLPDFPVLSSIKISTYILYVSIWYFNYDMLSATCNIHSGIYCINTCHKDQHYFFEIYV